ncbi:MAG: TIGR03943 family protein [Oscillospiraceae bacterium]|nr:TIGR03943 family protein [Oscillospiraceae bacterium]
MRGGSLNQQSVIETLAFTGFGAAITYCLLSGKYLSFVTPRLAPYLAAAALMMFVWGGMGFARWFRPRHRSRFAHCFVITVPLVVMLLPFASLSASDVRSMDSLNALSDLALGAGGQVPVPGEAASLPGLDARRGIVDISKDSYAAWMAEISVNHALYEGYTVTVDGMYYGMDASAEGADFAVERLMMYCCVADLTPVGIRCVDADGLRPSGIADGEWVRVTGGLAAMPMGDGSGEWMEPYLRVSYVERIDAEGDGYLYAGY